MASYTMELGHLPYKKRTYEDYVGARALSGNAKLSKKMPPLCRLGDNANAFKGGFRMWEGPLKGKITRSRKQTRQAAMAR